MYIKKGSRSLFYSFSPGSSLQHSLCQPEVARSSHCPHCCCCWMLLLLLTLDWILVCIQGWMVSTCWRTGSGMMGSARSFWSCFESLSEYHSVGCWMKTWSFWMRDKRHDVVGRWWRWEHWWRGSVGASWCYWRSDCETQWFISADLQWSFLTSNLVDDITVLWQTVTTRAVSGGEVQSVRAPRSSDVDGWEAGSDNVLYSVLSFDLEDDLAVSYYQYFIGFIIYWLNLYCETFSSSTDV